MEVVKRMHRVVMVVVVVDGDDNGDAVVAEDDNGNDDDDAVKGRPVVLMIATVELRIMKRSQFNNYSNQDK